MAGSVRRDHALSPTPGGRTGAPTTPDRRRRTGRRPALALVIAVVAVASSCQVQAPTAATWTFDDLPAGTVLRPAGRAVVRDSSGNGHPLRIPPNNTGSITAVAGPSGGTSLQFPRSGRASLQLGSPTQLDPGRRDIEVSAWVAIPGDRIAPEGANVVQKGLATGSMWKVQLDGGIAGCGFIDTEGRSVLWTGSTPHRINDGGWYKITCRKTATEVSLTVRRSGQPEPPADTTAVVLGAISNSAVVTVGSKGTDTDYDQFRGRIDSVQIRLS